MYRLVLLSCDFSSVSLHTRDVIAGAGVAGTACNLCRVTLLQKNFVSMLQRPAQQRFRVSPARRSGVGRAIDCLLAQDFFGYFPGGDAWKLLMLEVEFFRYLKSGDLVSQKAINSSAVRLRPSFNMIVAQGTSPSRESGMPYTDTSLTAECSWIAYSPLRSQCFPHRESRCLWRGPE